MQLKSEHFNNYMSSPLKDIPEEALREITLELVGNAMFFMNTTEDDITIGRMVSVIIGLYSKDSFRFMPLHLLIQAFAKGSEGELGGTSRFHPRNVNIWLNAMHETFRRLLEQETTKRDDEIRRQSLQAYKNNHSSNILYGRATSLKLSWGLTRRIDPEDWDHYTLDSIVRLFKSGYDEKTMDPELIYMKKQKVN